MRAWLMEMIVFYGFVGLCAYGGVRGYQYLHDRNCEYKTVKDVGACNWLGNCAVRFSDGSIANAEKPIPGAKACVR